ncbi:glycosyltransferase family 2 protein [Aquabacterium sp.]|uniref:glycosyltransferase family 2 protein n=1 Tax=Aquabacterium sp. TaxID=1872578 RepID=UPI001993C897|nr:glycosyltransferase family 2 protein [Aquabacterium sp.]MBC7701338.1 glycosyltransferase family 2 protein [Aquabacterium sp.]
MSFHAAGDPAAPVSTLGVVIVNYRTFDLTMQCVRSLLEHQIAKPSDIVVVDNLSPDGSGERLNAALDGGVRVILSSRNGGFGAGVNLGVAASRTDLVLVLNPDTYFLSNSVDVIKGLFDERPRLGIAGLKLINPDGSLQYSARRFYSLPDIMARRTPLGRLGAMQGLIRSHLLKRRWRGGPFEADWVMGTGFVLRRSAFDQIGGMDEDYFLYFEEVDLCARMWINSWQVLALPQVELVHEHQRHSAAGIWSTSGKIHLRSMNRFFDKFGIPWVRRPTHADLAAAFARWRERRHSERILEQRRGG